jgi:hypothetical protein
MIFGNFKNQLTSRLGESNGVRGQEPLLRRVEDFDIYS